MAEVVVRTYPLHPPVLPLNQPLFTHDDTPILLFVRDVSKRTTKIQKVSWSYSRKCIDHRTQTNSSVQSFSRKPGQAADVIDKILFSCSAFQFAHRIARCHPHPGVIVSDSYVKQKTTSPGSLELRLSPMRLFIAASLPLAKAIKFTADCASDSAEPFFRQRLHVGNRYVIFQFFSPDRNIDPAPSNLKTIATLKDPHHKNHLSMPFRSAIYRGHIDYAPPWNNAPVYRSK